MRVLALDIAATTGWAFTDDKIRASGAQKFSSALGPFADEFETWLLALIERYSPDLVAVEGLIPIRGQTRLVIQLRAYGAHTLVHKACHRYGIELQSVDVGRWRKQFIGRARAPQEIGGHKLASHQRRSWLKKTALAECERRGWRAATDDEADAIGVLSFVVNQDALVKTESRKVA